MSCRITNLTYDEVRDAFVNKTGIFDNLENITPEEIIAKIELLQQFVSVKTIPNELLPKTAYKSPTGETERYVITNPNTGEEFIVPGRFTDVVQKKFERIRGRKDATEISENPDNRIKADSGTKVHAIAEQLTHNIVNNDEAFNKTKAKNISKEELAKQYGVDITIINETERIVKQHLEFFKETQQKIDKNGKITIATELLLPDSKYNKMGRGDLVAIFSDSSAGYIDYKTMSINDTKANVLDNKGRVVDSDWISDYKYEDFALQLNQVNRTLTDLGVNKIRFSRISPIYLNNFMKKKDEVGPGKKLSTKIRTIQGTGEYFKPIPIAIEETGIKALDNAISEMLKLKNNYERRLEKESPSSDKALVLRSRIAKLNKSIQTLIVDKDMTYVIDAYNKIINNVGSLDKKDLEELIELSDDVQVYISIVSTAPAFYRTLNLEKEELQKNINQSHSVLGRLTDLQILLKEKLINQVLNEDELKAATSAKELTWVDKLFKSLSQIDHPVFQKFYNMYSEANDKTRKKISDLESNIKNYSKSLEDWGAKNGYTGWDVYNLLINKETGNLHSILTSDFYENFKKYQEDNKKKELLEIVKLKDNWEEIYNTRKTKYIINNQINEDDPKDKMKLLRWEAQNHPTNGKVLYSKYWGIYYEYKPEVFKNENYMTKEYKFIKSHKELLEYYNFWTESMKEARFMLGHSENEQFISHNFIPWIKKETLEMVFESGIPTFEQVKDKITEVWSTAQDETKYGEITDRTEQNLQTGKALRQIPRFFLQPFQNEKGEIDKTMKSYDLNKSLYMFMTMAYNYNNLSQIEAQTNALQTLIYQPEFGEAETDSQGNIIKTVSGRSKKLFGYASDAADLFQKHVDYHLYGIKLQDKQSSSTETLQSLRKYQQVKELAFSPLVIATNYLGQQGNLFFEGSKGFFYNRKQMLDTIKMHKKALIPGTEEQDKWASVLYLFRPYGELTDVQFTKDIRVSKALKYINEDNLMWGYRNADEHTSNLVLMTMMKNYGIDKDGNVKRLAILSEGTKSLYENLKVKDGKAEIEGLTDAGYTQFRNTVMNVARNIKGSMSREDMSAIHFTTVGQLAMSFKSWLPALAMERFDKLGYDKTYDLIKQGRYNSLFNELGADYEKGLSVWLPQVMKRTALFTLDVATFGNTNMLKVNENRAKAMFEDYLSKNPHLLTTKSKDELYKEFLEYKRGNLKATAAELFMVFALLLALAGLGKYWDDDSYERRTSMRLLRRVTRELSFFINPQSVQETAGRGVVPLLGILQDIQRLGYETYDESTDAIFGEDSNKDKIGILYRARPFIPGAKFTMVYETFDEDEKRKY